MFLRNDDALIKPQVGGYHFNKPPTTSMRTEYDHMCLELSQRATKALSRTGMSGVSALLKTSLSMVNLKDVCFDSVTDLIESLIQDSPESTDYQFNSNPDHMLFEDPIYEIPLSYGSEMSLLECGVKTPSTQLWVTGSDLFDDYRLIFKYETADLGEKIKILESLTRQHSATTDQVSKLAGLYEEQGLFIEAINVYERFLLSARPRAAVKSIKTMLFRSYMARGNHEAAIKLSMRYPNEPLYPIDRARLPDAYLGVGNQKAAEELVVQLLNECNGEIWLMKKVFKGAMTVFREWRVIREVCQKSLERNPNSKNLKLQLFLSYLEEDSHGHAKIFFEDICERSQLVHKAQACELMFEYCWRKKEMRAAMDAYKRLRDSKHSFDSHYSYGWNILGKTAVAVGDYEVAIDAFQRVINDDGGYSDTWRGLWEALRGHYDEDVAIREYETRAGQWTCTSKSDMIPKTPKIWIGCSQTGMDNLSVVNYDEGSVSGEIV